MSNAARHYRRASLALIVGLLAAQAGALPEPTELLSAADVEKVLGGKFEPRIVEPGVVFFEERDGPRQVDVIVNSAEGRRIADLKATFLGQGEPVEDIEALGEAGFYRPQRGEVELEKSHGGEMVAVSVVVQNVDDAASRRKFAIELAKLVAAKH